MRFSLQNIKNLVNLVKELEIGLSKLDLINNFESFQVTVNLPANSVTQIRNRLTSIPTRRIILRQDKGVIISDSSTPWSLDYVYLENHHVSQDVNVTVIFLR